MATRYFTLEQAQALLPLVRSLMGQALQLHGHLRKAISRLSDNGHEINWALLRGEEQLAESDQRSTDALERARMIYFTLRETVAKIEALGAEVKGVMDGLVDFRSWRDGEHEVLLCFKLGESEIRFFHGVDEGFDGRRSIAGHRFSAACESGQDRVREAKSERAEQDDERQRGFDADDPEDDGDEADSAERERERERERLREAGSQRQ